MTTGRRRGGPRGIDWDAQPLRKMTDAELARRLGVTPGAVWQARKARRIPPFKRRAKGIDWGAQPLGKMTDPALAERLGCSRTAVQYNRDKRGILPFAA